MVWYDSNNNNDNKTSAPIECSISKNAHKIYILLQQFNRESMDSVQNEIFLHQISGRHERIWEYNNSMNWMKLQIRILRSPLSLHCRSSLFLFLVRMDANRSDLDASKEREHWARPNTSTSAARPSSFAQWPVSSSFASEQQHQIETILFSSLNWMQVTVQHFDLLANFPVAKQKKTCSQFHQFNTSNKLTSETRKGVTQQR